MGAPRPSAAMHRFQPPPRARSGFSLIEMIGVFAIIALLAVAIVPRVFATIGNSRVASAVNAVNAMQTAVADFATRYGVIPATGANARVDDLLMTAGYIDGRFTARIGTPPSAPPVTGAAWRYASGVWSATGGSSQEGETRLICVPSTTANPAAARGGNYRLDGSTNIAAGSFVTSVVFANVTGAQARALSQAIDGDSLSAAGPESADPAGKVVYAAPDARGLTTVYVYLAQQ
jgi:type II secretory pathway pseudopilin PulG